MAIKVGEYLKHDPLKLRFTQSNGQNGLPKTVIRRMANSNVAEMIQPSYMASTSNLLYYELLEVSIIELETKKSLRITWVNAQNKEDVSCSLSLLRPRVSSSADPCFFAGCFVGTATFLLITEEYDDGRGGERTFTKGGQVGAGRRIGCDQNLRYIERSCAETLLRARSGARCE